MTEEWSFPDRHESVSVHCVIPARLKRESIVFQSRIPLKHLLPTLKRPNYRNDGRMVVCGQARIRVCPLCHSRTPQAGIHCFYRVDSGLSMSPHSLRLQIIGMTEEWSFPDRHEFVSVHCVIPARFKRESIVFTE